MLEHRELKSVHSVIHHPPIYTKEQQTTATDPVGIAQHNNYILSCLCITLHYYFVHHPNYDGIIITSSYLSVHVWGAYVIISFIFISVCSLFDYVIISLSNLFTYLIVNLITALNASINDVSKNKARIKM